MQRKKLKSFFERSHYEENLNYSKDRIIVCKTHFKNENIGEFLQKTREFLDLEIYYSLHLIFAYSLEKKKKKIKENLDKILDFSLLLGGVLSVLPKL